MFQPCQWRFTKSYTVCNVFFKKQGAKVNTTATSRAKKMRVELKELLQAAGKRSAPLNLLCLLLVMGGGQKHISTCGSGKEICSHVEIIFKLQGDFTHSSQHMGRLLYNGKANTIMSNGVY